MRNKTLIAFFAVCFIFIILCAACHPKAKMLETPTNLRLSGATASWNGVDGCIGYTLSLSGVEVETTDVSYDLADFPGISFETTYSVAVKARGDGTTKLDSAFSDPIPYTHRHPLLNSFFDDQALSSEPCASSQNPAAPTVLDSYTDGESNNYLIDVGYVHNMYIATIAEVQYNGGPGSLSKTVTTTSQLTQSLTESISEAVTIASSESVKVGIGAEIKLGFIKLRPSLEWQGTWSKSDTSTKSKESTLTTVNSYTESLTIAYDFDRSLDPPGRYRCAVYGVCDVYFILKTTSDNQSIIDWGVSICARGNVFHSFEYSSSGSFNNAPTGTIDFTDDFYKWLPEISPLEPAIWDGSVATGFSFGTGTHSNPYRITNAAQLAYLAYLVNNNISGYNDQSIYYQLTADILLNDTKNLAEWGEMHPDTAKMHKWTPIGHSAGSDMSKAFQANFDGGGHKVYGVYINSTVSEAGLFGCVSGGVIHDLGVEQGFVKGGAYIGGIAGALGGNTAYGGKSGIIYNCYNATSIACDVSGQLVFVDIGGIVGLSVNNSYVINCYNTGSVSGVCKGYLNFLSVGGLIGMTSDGGGVMNCYNTGNVSCVYADGGDGNLYCGGVAGIVAREGIMINCYNKGSVVSGNLAGGVAGSVVGAVSFCYYLSSTASKGVDYINGGTVTDTCSFNGGGVLETGVVIGGKGCHELTEALNAWVAAPTHIAPSGVTYSTWSGTPCPVFAGTDYVGYEKRPKYRNVQ